MTSSSPSFVPPSESPLAPRNNIQKLNPVDDNIAMLPSVPPRQKENTDLLCSHQPLPPRSTDSSYCSPSKNPPKPLGDEKKSDELALRAAVTQTFGKLRGGDSKKLQKKKEENEKLAAQNPATAGIKTSKNEHQNVLANSNLKSTPDAKINNINNGNKKKIVDLSKIKYITYVTTKSKHVLIEVIPSKIPNYEDPAVAAHFPNSSKRMCEYLHVPFPSWTNTTENRERSVMTKKGINKSNESQPFLGPAKDAKEEGKPLQQHRGEQQGKGTDSLCGGTIIDESVPASGLRYAASKVELNKSIRNALSLNEILTPSDVAELIVLSSSSSPSSLSSDEKRKLREIQHSGSSVSVGSTTSEELENEKVIRQKRLLEALLSATTEHTASPSASGGTTPSKGGRSRTNSLIMNAFNPQQVSAEEQNDVGTIRAKIGDLADTAEAVVDNIDTLEDFAFAAKFILGRVANKASNSFRNLKNSVVLFKNATDETGFSSVERHGGGGSGSGEERDDDQESFSRWGDSEEERCLPASHNNDDNDKEETLGGEQQLPAEDDDEGDESAMLHEGQRLLRVRVVDKFNVGNNRDSIPSTMAAAAVASANVEDSISSGKVKKGGSNNDFALGVKKTNNIKYAPLATSTSSKDEDLSFFTFAFENRFRFPHLWRRLHVLRITKQRHFNAVFLKYKWLTQSKREVPIALHGLCFCDGSWQLRRKLNLSAETNTATTSDACSALVKKSGSKNNSFASNITTAKIVQIPKDRVNKDHHNDGGKRESESSNKDNEDESDRLLEILNNINKKKVNSLLLLDHKVHQPSATSSSASARFLKSDSSTSFSKRGVNSYGTANSKNLWSGQRDREEIDEIQKQQAGVRIIEEGQRAQEMLLPSAALMEILHEHRKKNDLFTDASLLHVHVQVREGGKGLTAAPTTATATADKSVFTTPFSFFSQLFGRDTAQNNIEALRQRQSQQQQDVEGQQKELALLYQSLPKILRNTAMCDLAVAKAFGSLYGKGVGTDDLKRFHEQVWPMRVLKGKYGICRGGIGGGLERSASSGVFAGKNASFASSSSFVSSASDGSHGPTPTKAKSRLTPRPAAQTALEQQQVEPSPHAPHHTTINIPVWGGGYLISEYQEAESARQREELDLQQMAAEARRNSLRLERQLKLSEKDVDRSIKVEAVRDKVLMSMDTNSTNNEDHTTEQDADSDGGHTQGKTEKAPLQQQQRHHVVSAHDNRKSSNYDSLREHGKDGNSMAKKKSTTDGSSVLISRDEERRLREFAIMERDGAEEAAERRKMAAAEKAKRLTLTELRHNMSLDEVPVGRHGLLRAVAADDEKGEGEAKGKEPTSGLLNPETHIDPHSGEQPLQQARHRLSQSSTSSADPLLVASVSHKGEEESRIDHGQDERVVSPL